MNVHKSIFILIAMIFFILGMIIASQFVLQYENIQLLKMDEQMSDITGKALQNQIDFETIVDKYMQEHK